MDFGVLYYLHTGRLFHRVRYLKQMEIMRYCVRHIEIMSVISLNIFTEFLLPRKLLGCLRHL